MQFENPFAEELEAQEQKAKEEDQVDFFSFLDEWSLYKTPTYVSYKDRMMPNNGSSPRMGNSNKAILAS